MEQVELRLPGDGSGTVSALRFQDLPAEHVLAWMTMPPGMKDRMSYGLLRLALGVNSESVLTGLTFGELENMISEWFLASGEAEGGGDGAGQGLDWELETE